MLYNCTSGKVSCLNCISSESDVMIAEILTEANQTKAALELSLAQEEKKV